MSEPDFDAIARKHGLPELKLSDLQSGTEQVANVAALRESYALGLRKAAKIALAHPYPAHSSSGGMIANEIRTEADKWSR
tara:strand:- start:2586 stop:2825 length:240 start_codon:yes stop_codon:yes gene_type:complete